MKINPTLLTFITLLMFITSLGFAQTIIDLPGTHNLWSGTTLLKNTTLTSKAIHTGHFAYMGIWVKTTNEDPDSIDYRLHYRGAMSKTDTFAIASDTMGNEIDATIMRVSDTLWHYCSVRVPCAAYTKIYATSDPTEHGDSTRIYVKLYLWRPGYWYEFRNIED